MTNHGGKKKKVKKGFFRRMIGGKGASPSKSTASKPKNEIEDDSLTTSDNGESSREDTVQDNSTRNDESETSKNGVVQEEGETSKNGVAQEEDETSEKGVAQEEGITDAQNHTSTFERESSSAPHEPAKSKAPLEPEIVQNSHPPLLSLASDVDNNDDRYMSVEAGTYSDDKDGKGIELHVDFEGGRDAVSTTGKFTSDSEAKKSTSDEKVAKKIEEQVDSEGDSDAVSTYSNRYRKKMYKQLLVSIDTQISANTNDLIDEYLSHVRDINASSRDFLEYSASFSSDESDEDDKELCVYIDNYIDDAYNGAITNCKTGDIGNSRSERILQVDDNTLRATENYIKRRPTDRSNVKKNNTFGKIKRANTSSTMETGMTSFELD